MKILIVSTNDIQGGAAKAANRLHQALIQENIDSKMLVQFKTGGDHTVLESCSKFGSQVRSYLDVLPNRLYKNRTKTPFSNNWIPSSNILQAISSIKPDIVHLQWVCGGMLRIEDIAKIKAPIIWTLQDMWAFTGGCHYDEFCGEFASGCNNCRVLRDDNCLLSKINFNRKRNTFSKMKSLRLVALGQWISEQLKKSNIFGNTKQILLSLPIDTKVFKPLEKNFCRKIWNLPTEKKLILFGAVSAVHDKRKGYEQLLTALEILDKNTFELVVFGSSDNSTALPISFKTNYVGHIHDETSLATLYCACDVMIVPSLQETFGQTSSESLSGGTPVVGFDETGTASIINHKVNGYLAKPFDSFDLARGIKWILSTPSYGDICQNAREKALTEFDNQVVARKCIELYKDVLTSENV